MSIETTIGLIGTLLILFAFFMNQKHRWNDTDLRYDVLNFLGARLLIWYSVLISAWPFAVLNCAWALISLKDILKRK